MDPRSLAGFCAHRGSWNIVAVCDLWAHELHPGAQEVHVGAHGTGGPWMEGPGAQPKSALPAQTCSGLRSHTCHSIIAVLVAMAGFTECALHLIAQHLAIIPYPQSSWGRGI